jgi:hypothetical protein
VTDEINTEYIIQKARMAGESAGADMTTVHGLLWEGRENLAKLIISLSSAILVGTITFSGDLLGTLGATPTCPSLIIYSWALLFFSICTGLFSLWQANILKSFRIRFMNSEPALEKEAAQLNPALPPEELQEQIVAIVKKYSDASLNPLGPADRKAHYALNTALVLFGLGVGLFLIYGSLQVT